ncbi:class I SAM-dependent methyltransferase [Chryseobacterium sp. Ch-15]|uniref:Class I SAM-dependent methyltransferase n=1 Tax=Chryseobacterium muglaense TaxID=2893752 RepID=A0A9Q3UQZ5_9FLAO|nr:class I SAM-dependent methyltransferase [Chryseobacterium muglaense]MBD3905330.1 class I SAM-dependent methyltransferase [Chryseobacterium muglaense]MCC9033913.1 class I SAM-dependent methyltransferase [Chryseobacterium muglaense]MCM2554132.1 class I SAM-dependent methyltransferase [Chryseobacterium muglaense]
MNSEKQNYKDHWENVYETKNPNEVSWTQKVPQTSLNLIEKVSKDKSSKIIDIGGGDSNLVDFLLEKGFKNISVLDISAKALEKAKTRLGAQAENVDWIVTDITEFKTNTEYDIWHDRAAFHFLTTEDEIKKYVEIVRSAVSDTLIIGTFSLDGPQKCSGLPILQYNEERLKNIFSQDFELVKSFTENHITPFNTVQNFIFCQFKKK